MTVVEVIVPWRIGSSPARKQALQRVLEGLHAAGFSASLAIPYDDRPWSPGRARNHGARFAVSPVLVFNDADTLVPPEQIREAHRAAQSLPGLVYAYDLYLRRDPDGRPDRELFNPPSMGCVAISRQSFDRVGGFDESYEGWGYEDCEFATRCNRVWPVRRVQGIAEHLWHGDRRQDDSPTDTDEDQVKRNYERWKHAVYQASI